MASDTKQKYWVVAKAKPEGGYTYYHHSAGWDDRVEDAMWFTAYKSAFEATERVGGVVAELVITAVPEADKAAEPEPAARLVPDGVALRDWFAAHALAGVLAFSPPETFAQLTPDDAAFDAYAYADAMLKRREV